MNKLIKTFIFGLVTLIGIGAFANTVQANSDLIVELMSPSWNTIYGGETKLADLKIINNTGHLLDGEATFSVWYKNTPFQGTLDAINISFDLTEDSSQWEDGKITFSNFEILEGETLTILKMNTHPTLMPGQYSFLFTLKGSTEKEVHTTSISGGSGGGGYYYQETVIEEDTLIIDTAETTISTIVIEDTTNIIEEKSSSDPFIVNEEIIIPEDSISTVTVDIDSVSRLYALIVIMILCLLILLIFIIIRIRWKSRKKWKT